MADDVAAEQTTPNPNVPTIATSFNGPPTLGPILETGQRRALLGWTHKKDTPEGLLSGRLWCWVSEGVREALQVYDSAINRSPFPVGTGRGSNAAAGSMIIDCGVANFGMVRMFHPWWCPHGRVPKDMNIADKRMCRHRYRQLITRGNRRGGIARGRGRVRESEEVGDDDVNRRKEGRKRRRRVLMQDAERNRKEGTRDRPVVVVDDEDDGGAKENGGRSEGRKEGEMLGAIEDGGAYREVGAEASEGENEVEVVNSEG